MTKPTVEQILQRKVAGHCHEHVVWETQKKEAKKQVDTSLLKKGLGPALDNLHSLVKGAEEVKRYYPKLDERTLKPVREARKKVDGIARDYVKLCDQQAQKAGLTAEQKRAWSLLSGSAAAIPAKTKVMTKGIL